MLQDKVRHEKTNFDTLLERQALYDKIDSYFKVVHTLFGMLSETSYRMDKSRSFFDNNFDNVSHATDRYEGKDYKSKLFKLDYLEGLETYFNFQFPGVVSTVSHGGWSLLYGIRKCLRQLEGLRSPDKSLIHSMFYGALYSLPDLLVGNKVFSFNKCMENRFCVWIRSDPWVEIFELRGQFYLKVTHSVTKFRCFRVYFRRACHRVQSCHV